MIPGIWIWYGLNASGFAWSLIWGGHRWRSEAPRIRTKLWVAGAALEFLALFLLPAFPLEQITPLRALLCLLAAPLASYGAWAAVCSLGPQGQAQTGLRPRHRLVTRGPYRVVRHPLYASFFCLFLSTGFLVTSTAAFAALTVLFLAGTELRVREEEAVLAEAFGERFLAYRQRVKAYLPLLR